MTRHTSRITLKTSLMAAAVIGTALCGTAQAERLKRPSAQVVEEAKVALASPEQMVAADRVLVGQYDCEFGQRVSIDRNDTHQGYFDLRLGKQSWVMKPVLTQTGAVRLEDVRGGALMIQILTKSMLLDPRKGQRLVDGCVHEVQRQAERELASRPRQSMLGGN